MLALARKIVSGGEEDAADTVEAVFAGVSDARVDAEELLVDHAWKAVEVEPELVAVETHRDGTNATNGTGPGVEFVLATNGHGSNGTGPAEAGVNGDGNAGSIEGQRSLFSWAEFLEEPAGKRRNGRSRPAPRPCSTGRSAYNRSGRRRRWSA